LIWDYSGQAKGTIINALGTVSGISELGRFVAVTEAYDIALAADSPLGPIARAGCLLIGTCVQFKRGVDYGRASNNI
jgi:hypothetical protein